MTLVYQFKVYIVYVGLSGKNVHCLHWIYNVNEQKDHNEVKQINKTGA